MDNVRLECSSIPTLNHCGSAEDAGFPTVVDQFENRPAASPLFASVKLGATATLIDKALHRIPVVSEVIDVIDSFFGFFGGGNDDAAQVRQLLDQEADAFIHTFDGLIQTVNDAADLEQVAQHINRAASSVTDRVSLQRIAMRLQSTMAAKAVAIAADAKQALGAEMKASVKALEARKKAAEKSGKKAVQEAVDAADRELQELAEQGKGFLDDKLQNVEAMGDMVSAYIARLEALRDKVMKAAQQNADGLGDLAAGSRSAEFSKRASSVSARRPGRGTRTTTVPRAPIRE